MSIETKQARLVVIHQSLSQKHQLVAPCRLVPEIFCWVSLLCNPPCFFCLLRVDRFHEMVERTPCAGTIQRRFLSAILSCICSVPDRTHGRRFDSFPSSSVGCCSWSTPLHHGGATTFFQTVIFHLQIHVHCLQGAADPLSGTQRAWRCVGDLWKVGDLKIGNIWSPSYRMKLLTKAGWLVPCGASGIEVLKSETKLTVAFRSSLKRRRFNVPNACSTAISTQGIQGDFHNLLWHTFSSFFIDLCIRSNLVCCNLLYTLKSNLIMICFSGFLAFDSELGPNSLDTSPDPRSFAKMPQVCLLYDRWEP